MTTDDGCAVTTVTDRCSIIDRQAIRRTIFIVVLAVAVAVAVAVACDDEREQPMIRTHFPHRFDESKGTQS